MRDRRQAVLKQLAEAVMAVDQRQIDALVDRILAAEEVFCSGLGRSGLASRAFAMRLMHMGRKVSVVGDTLAHRIGSGGLLLITSASGASKALAYDAEKARAEKAAVAVITATPDSALDRISDVSVLLKAPNKTTVFSDEASVLPMGSLFEEAVFVLYDIVVLELMERLGLDRNDMASRHANLE